MIIQLNFFVKSELIVIVYFFFGLDVIDVPEVFAEKTWVHAGIGTLTELVCHVDAVPAAQVNIKTAINSSPIPHRKSITFTHMLR